MALMLPWLVFLFIGAFDWGYYAHALISTENAARVAATYASTNSTDAADSTNVCLFALEELRIVPNISSTLSTCTASPVIVTTALIGPGQANTNSADGQLAALVSVQYTTLQLIPIPGLLKNQATFYRTVQMRTRS
jgi:Flp pilus assembly protein TadG